MLIFLWVRRVRGVEGGGGGKTHFETKFGRLYRVFLTSKPAAGGNFSGICTPFEGKTDHFGGLNRFKNEGKRHERVAKGVIFSGAPSGATKALKPSIVVIFSPLLGTGGEEEA